MQDWFLSQDTLLLVGLVAVFVLLRFLPQLLAGVPFVPPSELKQRMDRGEDVTVIDVREPSEFRGDLGHVPGALNLPLSQLSAKLQEAGEGLSASRDEPVYVVCRTSNRAAHGARTLKKAGLTDVKVLKGGMVRWNNASYPTRR